MVQARSHRQSADETHVVAAEIGLELSGQDLERRALPDAVRPDEAEDLAGPRGGQAVELERVGGVAVRDLGLEVRREVDDGDGLERASARTLSDGRTRCGGGGALSDADAAADAQELGDERDLVRRLHLYTQLAWTRTVSPAR